MRVIGDPNLPVTKVATGRGMNIPEECDAKISIDVQEWDSCEYARDTVYSGRRKGVIFISHGASEDTGMQEFARFLKPLVPEVQVHYISTECVFWSV